jgi:Ca2+/H+ antiporter
VNALLIPAAFHFVFPKRNGLADDASGDSEDNARHDILKMSRGVSIILILIYAAYLFFQLKSHDHLYEDKEKKCPSRRISFSNPKETLPKELEVEQEMEKIGLDTPTQTQLEGGVFCRDAPTTGMDNARTAVNSPVECTPTDQEEAQMSWTITIILLIFATAVSVFHLPCVPA